MLGLDALDEIDALALVARLGAQGLAARRMVERADGNPLFLEQLVASGRRASCRRPSRRCSRRASTSSARTSARCSSTPRSTAGASAAARSRRSATSDLTAPLTALVRRQLIHPERSPGDDGFRFAHALIREVAYAAAQAPARGPPRAARRLAAATPDPEDEVVGYHLERACAYRAELGLPREDALVAEAVQRLASAARGALRRGDPRPARRCSSARSR